MAVPLNTGLAIDGLLRFVAGLQAYACPPVVLNVIFCAPHKLVSARVLISGDGLTVISTLSEFAQPVLVFVPVTVITWLVVSVKYGFGIPELLTESGGDQEKVVAVEKVFN